ncbi:CGNR zinc finger domain-containing protein [Saccharopolyspora sp. CA-218241]|uniref:CGNR zinc finger domain-containing protein n=1 Tax=Saccharopolyspora sp. CA-218241 TaxID=3240027 RepID=UPI003D955415
MSYDRPAAPGPLEAVESFANTARLLRQEDQLADLGGAVAWLRGRGCEEAAAALDETGRQEMVGLREALRAHLGGQSAAELDAASRRLLGAPQWRDGGPRIAVLAADPVRRVLGEVVRSLAEAELAGADRLKVCRAEDCRWVFYDRSPAGNATWCSMDICGARHKMRTYRSRRSTG